MNTKFVKTAAFVGGLLGLTMSLSAETPLITFNTPFAFVAGGKTLPAGNYVIEEPNKSGVLIVRGQGADSAAVVLAVKADAQSASGKANVTFSKSGSEVLLSTIQIPAGVTYSLVSTEHKLAANAAVPKVALHK